MATVRKIKWKRSGGKETTAFQLTYFDEQGRRRRQNFKSKGKADDERIRIESEVQDGRHVPDSASATVADGLQLWLKHVDRQAVAKHLARITARKYRSQIENHVLPRPVSSLLLNKLKPSDVQNLVDGLSADLSPQMAAKVYTSFKIGLKHCRTVALLKHNPADGIKLKRSKRHDKPSISIPDKADIKRLLAAAADDISGQDSAMIRLMLFRGLRISEIRGLPRLALDLSSNSNPTIEVLQSASETCEIEPPKSKAAYRKLSLTPDDVFALRKWLLSNPDKNGLVFGNRAGKPHSYANLYNRWWKPLMARAGLVKEGLPVFSPHDLRHCFASLHIEAGTQPKQLQVMMGHSSIKVTMDIYGHLWRDEDKEQALALAVESRLA